MEHGRSVGRRAGARGARFLVPALVGASLVTLVVVVMSLRTGDDPDVLQPTPTDAPPEAPRVAAISLPEPPSVPRVDSAPASTSSDLGLAEVVGEAPEVDDSSSASQGGTLERRPLTVRLVRLADGSPLVVASAQPFRPRGYQLSASGEVAITDDAGIAVFDSVTVDARTLQVALPGETDRVHAPLRDDWPEVTGVVDVTVDTGWSISGRVVDGLGEPVVGAQVTSVWPLIGDPGHLAREIWDVIDWTVTDAGGNFALSDVAAHYRGVPSTSWAREVRVTVASPEHLPGEQWITLEPELRVHPPLFFSLNQGGVLEGQVRDARGQGQDDVLVKLALRVDGDGVRVPEPALQAMTRGDEGHFRIESIPPGEYLVLAGGAHPPGPGGAPSQEEERSIRLRMASTWLPGVEILPGQVTRLDALLAEGASIHGMVVDASGLPAAGCRVTARASQTLVLPDFVPQEDLDAEGLQVEVSDYEARVSQLLGSTLTNGQGEFALHDLPPGQVDLSAGFSGDAGSQQRGLSLVPGDVLTGRLLHVPGGLRVAGRVEAFGSSSLRGQAWVGTLPEGGRMRARDTAWMPTDEDGRFVVGGLSDEPVRLAFRAEGRGTQVIRVDPPQDDLRVKLHRATYDRFQLTDGDTGEAIDSVEMLATGPDFTRQDRLEAYGGGLYLVTDMPSEAYELVLSAPGYRSKTFRVGAFNNPYFGRDLGALTLERP